MSRDLLAEALRAENIDTRKYYDPACHRMMAFRRYLAPERELPATERLSAKCLSLPIWSMMEDEMASKICSAIEMIHEHRAEITALTVDARDSAV